ncbi:hypothetical protein [Egicoccus sp. AB-alg2]|uniref:hypothetical protein n=1 Tax=Egicoccus sp. AB-alg2 TaxID=3242693 RepID=UPI00359E9B32
MGEREVAAPALRETADVWFDRGRDPVVTWDAAARRFELADPAEPDARLLLWVAPVPVTEPLRLATVLAEGLAACDFPPTGDGASPDHVRRTLRAAGLDPEAP